MPTQMTQKQIKEIIIQELPKLFKKDREVKRYLLDITNEKYADKEKTEDRFDRILDELKQDREKSEKKWEKWQLEDKIKWEAQEKKWEEWRLENKITLEAQEKKWEENQRVINNMLNEIRRLGQKHDSTLGALGARWGLQTEKAFRDALKSILEDSFKVKVEQYLDYDEEGIVFDVPDQVEMDVIIHNGTLILCEIKSSISQSEMHTFWRKKVFYEKKHLKKADRMIVISPMVQQRAMQTAQKLGIEVFGYAMDVTL